MVHVASLQDRESVPFLVEPIKGVFPRPRKKSGSILGTQAKDASGSLSRWGGKWRSFDLPGDLAGSRVPHGDRSDLKTVWFTYERIKLSPRGFRHLPRRWVVERTFAWIGRNRRMSKEYEYLPRSSQSMVQLTMIRLMVRRLAGTTETARENAQRRRAA